MNVHGRAAAEVGAVFERAGEVARQLESSVDLAPPLAGLWLFHLNRGKFARAEEIVEELFNVARNLDNRDILLQAHHAAWSTGLFCGRFTDARTHVDAGLALYDEARQCWTSLPLSRSRSGRLRSVDWGAVAVAPRPPEA